MKLLGKTLNWAFLLFGFAMILKGLYILGIKVTLFGVLPVFAAIYFIPRESINIASLGKLLLLFFTALTTYFSLGLLIIDGTIIISKILTDALMFTGALAFFAMISGQLQKNQTS